MEYKQVDINWKDHSLMESTFCDIIRYEYNDGVLSIVAKHKEIVLNMSEIRSVCFYR